MARTGRPTAQIVLTDGERETLDRWARRSRSAQALGFRCRIVLAAAEDRSNTDIAADLGYNPTTRASGGTASPSAASTASTTSPVRASLARSATPTWSG